MEKAKKAVKTPTEERFIIRMPPGMRNKINALATNGRRSLNSQYVLMLQSFIDEIESKLYENKEGFWDDLINDDNLTAQSSIQSHVDLKTRSDMMDLISQSLVFLRDYLRKTEALFSVLETKHLTMQLVFWKQKPESASKPVTEQDLAKAKKEIDVLGEKLKEARELLKDLHPVDPAKIKPWEYVAEDMPPQPLTHVNERMRIDQELTNNFSKIALAIYHVRKLEKEDNNDLYDRSK